MSCPIRAQFNINSIRNKFQFLEKQICVNLDILIMSEIKLDNSFPSSQFLLDEFLKPHRLDRCWNGGGILIYIRDDIPAHLFSNSNKTESIVAGLVSRKRNG